MSLKGEYDPDNVFARIVRGEITCAKVFEDAETLVFMDAFPQSRGHMLVISKQSRARNLLEAAPEVVSILVLNAQRAAQAVCRALKPDGVVITQFNGAAAGQSVFHLHIHVIPRWESQALKGHASSGGADRGELEALAREISAVF